MVEQQTKRSDPSSERSSTPPGSDRHDGVDQLQAGVTDESVLAARMAEFQQEREQWELHRQTEVERLRREGDLLAEAWQRLEAEERRLLAERELLRRGAINRSSSERSPNSPPTHSQAQTGETSQPGDYNQDPMAWLQFKQLRREFQKYRRRAT
jgi:hypothetical protein